MKDNWIDVNDRLPGKTRILGVECGTVFEVYFNKGKFYFDFNPFARIYEHQAKITHWQPLPDPPT